MLTHKIKKYTQKIKLSILRKIIVTVLLIIWGKPNQFFQWIIIQSTMKCTHVHQVINSNKTQRNTFLES